MGRWLKKLSELRAHETDKADNANAVSVVSANNSHFHPPTAKYDGKTQLVATDKTDKAIDVSFVSSRTPFVQNDDTPCPEDPEQVLAELALELSADAHMLRRLLSADDLLAIAEGVQGYSRKTLKSYFLLEAQAGKPLFDPDWHVEKMRQQDEKRRCEHQQKVASLQQKYMAARAIICNHLFDPCPKCYARGNRYCDTGRRFKAAYEEAYRRYAEASGR